MRNILNISLMGVVCMLLTTACGSSKHTAKDNANANVNVNKESGYVYVGRVSDNALTATSISSSIDFTIGDGQNDFTVGGKLRMMRDQVIRINLVFLGIKEVGIIEFTPTYVQIIDRIHAQYVKESYDRVSFLAQNGLSFYSLQSLFWNELFYPGTSKVTEGVLKHFSVSFLDAANASISLRQGEMSYSWKTERQAARITDAEMKYVSKSYGTTALHWTYSDFKKLAGRTFPYKQSFNLFSTAVANGQKATVTIKMQSAEIGKTFETTTIPSSKYKKVAAEALLKQLLSM